MTVERQNLKSMCTQSSSHLAFPPITETGTHWLVHGVSLPGKAEGAGRLPHSAYLLHQNLLAFNFPLVGDSYGSVMRLTIRGAL